MPNVRPVWLLTAANNVKTPHYRRLSTLTPKPQPTESSEDGARTLRVRKYNNRSLPLSPVMDPKAVNARTKYEQAKANPDRDTESPFQKQLRLNPYARALITPVRTCVISHARLPEHFLQQFVTRLETSTSNWQKATPQLAPALSKDRILDPTTGTVASRMSALAISTSRSYVFNNHSLLVAVSKKKKWAAIVSERMKEWVAAKRHVQPDRIKAKDIWTWPADTADATLSQRRIEVAGLIKIAFLLGKITPLTLSGPNGPPSECFVLRPAPAENTSSNASAFDLNFLLGDEFGSRFDLQDIEHSGMTVVANDESTLRLRVALLKLSTFLEPCVANLNAMKKNTPKPKSENDDDEAPNTEQIDVRHVP
ncbi:Hypothetical protein R9X50_00019300 [Acrodontium crateriforme]|uniref:Uncharacterized protein n=1 Tax=Acrodontium crateriforme TaxID=150365 RepID=A0AAQ3R4Q9_9PEZI|nr:Hypothetical protein R9X50_00019300 [Acrodontium crateriforme]